MPPRHKVLFLADESVFEREREPLSRRLDEVIEQLGVAGFGAAVVTVRSEWMWHERLESRGISAFTLHTESYGATPVAALRLARIVMKENPSLIHAMGPFCALISGFSRFLAPGPIRIYDRSHVSGGLRLNFGSWVAARLNDYTMARSGAVRDAAIAFDRSKPARVTVAFDGARTPRQVEDSEVSALRQRLGVPEGATTIGVVGRLRPEKGHLTLIEAMRVLAVSLPQPPHLLIVGAGPYESTIRSALRPDEAFVPHLVGYQEDVAPWLCVSDVVAIPSYEDASPKVAAEALGAGRPIVASKVGGIPEQITHGKNGILVPAHDAQALADAISALLVDEESQERLGRAGRVFFLDHLTIERRTERWLEYYREVLNEPG